MQDRISWKEYTAGKNLPKLLTIHDILKRQVDKEAEVLVELPQSEIPEYIRPNIKVTYTGLYGLLSKILP